MMKVFVTDALLIDLDSEQWECRRCAHPIASARKCYKEGMLVRDRDPSEIHAPILDPSRYEFTFAPDPAWCRLLEFYCPNCGHMAEVEYLPPGHPPAMDLVLDIDALKAQWAKREACAAPVLGPEDAIPSLNHHHHHH